MEYAFVKLKDTSLSEKETPSLSSEFLRVSATAFEGMVKASPEWLENVVIVNNPKDQIPLVFRKSYWRNGHTEKISACFAYRSGEAPHEDQVFGEAQRYKNIKEALQDQCKILLSLNLDLSYQSLDFSDTKDPNVLALNDWKYKNNYFSQPVKTIEEAVDAIHKVRDLGGNPKKDIYVSYGNAVVPYSYFYVAARQHDIADIYTNMRKGTSGTTFGTTRSVGFPRLMRFNLADTTKKENGVKGIKGKKIDIGDKHALLNNIVFSRSTEGERKQMRKDAMTEFNKSAAGVYILASPTISIGKAADQNNKFWRSMRWIVNDVGVQLRRVKITEPQSTLAIS